MAWLVAFLIVVLFFVWVLLLVIPNNTDMRNNPAYTRTRRKLNKYNHTQATNTNSNPQNYPQKGQNSP